MVDLPAEGTLKLSVNEKQHTRGMSVKDKLIFIHISPVIQLGLSDRGKNSFLRIVLVRNIMGQLIVHFQHITVIFD